MNTAAATEPPPGTEAAMRGATSARLVPRLFPEELRTPQPRPLNAPEPPWRRARPAKPTKALAEIADKIFTDGDRTEIQRLENELGKVDKERKLHCNATAIQEALWALGQDLALSPEEYSENARKLEEQLGDIPRWTVALDRRDA